MTTRKLEVVIAGDEKGLQKAFDNAAEAGKGFGGKMAKGMKAGGAAVLAAGAVLGALAAKGFADGVENQAQGSKFAAQLGGDPAEAERLGRIAGDLYADAYGDSLGDIQQIVRGVVRATNDELNDVDLSNVSAQVADLATTFDQDFSQVIQSAQTMVTNGLVPDFESALDTITRGLQTVGPAGGDEFLESMNEYSSAMKQLGIDGPEAVDLFNQSLDAGAFNVDKIGDAIKEFSIRGIEDVDAVTKAYESFGLNADETREKLANGGDAAQETFGRILDGLRSIEDPIKRNEAGIALFGTMWEDLGEDAVLAMDPMKAGLDDISDATERMGDTLNDNLRTKWEAFKRQGLMATAEFMEQKFIPTAEKVVEWAKSLASVFRDEGLSSGLHTLREDFGTAIDWIGEKVRDIAPIVGAHLRELGAEFVDWVAEATPPMLEKLGELLADLGRWVANTAVPAIGQQLAEWAQAFADWVPEAVPPLLDKLGELLESLSQWGREEALPKIVETLKEWIPAFVDWVGEVVPDLLTALGDLLIAIVEWVITDGIPKLREEALEWGKALLDSFGIGIEEKWEDVKTWLGDLGDKCADAVGDLGEVLKAAGAALVGGLIAGITGALPGLQTAISGITSLINSIPGLPDLSGGSAKGQGLAEAAASFRSGSGGTFKPTVTSFSKGGRVPGRIGQLVPILAHAGEEIRPLGNSGPGSGSGSGVTQITNVIELHGPATLQDADRIIAALQGYMDEVGPVPIRITKAGAIV